MNIGTPYRSSAAFSLDLKVIELGNWLEKLEQHGPNIEKLSIEIGDAFKRFGYKKLHHRDISVAHNFLFCISYYNFGRRLVVLSSEKISEPNGLTGYCHDDYYANSIEIDYIDKCDIVEEVVNLSDGKGYPIRSKLRGITPLL